MNTWLRRELMKEKYLKRSMLTDIKKLREENLMTIRKIARTLNITESNVRTALRHMDIV